MFAKSLVLGVTVPAGDLTICSWSSLTPIIQNPQTFTSFDVTTKSSPNFSYILTAPFSS
jgi:hypothetical protein